MSSLKSRYLQSLQHLGLNNILQIGSDPQGKTIQMTTKSTLCWQGCTRNDW